MSQPYPQRSSEAITVLAFFLGLAAGAVGTVLFAALDERKFHGVVKLARTQTRHAERLTQELADRTSDAVDELIHP